MASHVQTASVLHLMQEVDHPEKEIFEAVGDISGMEFPDTSMLVGIYIQQGRTKGGIITNRLSLESIYQGKVGVVLKMPLAPMPKSEIVAWDGKPPKVGDWVFFNPDNGQALNICGVGAKMSERLKAQDLELIGWPCRLVEAKYILGRVKDPRSVV